MNPWPFVIGAYALTLGGTAAMAAAAWIAMRRAEGQAERQRKK